MQRITQTIENKLYSYKPGEFLPIYYGGELANKRDFVIYKIRSLFR